MNTPNPLVPQGSLLEQQSKGRSRFRLFAFIVVALHAFIIIPVLIQGCKPESTSGPGASTATNDSYGTIATSNLTDTVTDVVNTATGYVGSGTTAWSNTSPVVATAAVNTVTGAFNPYLTDTTTAVAATSTHKIVAGDTLATVAKKYHVALKDLQAANPNINPTKMKIGDTLTIPASTVAPGAATTAVEGAASETVAYKVKAGDTLTKIAKDHGVTVKAIQSANGLKTTSIKAGDTLKIPVKAPAPAPAEPAPAPVYTPPPATPLAPSGTAVR